MSGWRGCFYIILSVAGMTGMTTGTVMGDDFSDVWVFEDKLEYICSSFGLSTRRVNSICILGERTSILLPLAQRHYHLIPR